MTNDNLLVSVYDTKSYDRDYLENAGKLAPGISWRFHEFRLNSETAMSAKGSQAVCVFVNDRLDQDCLRLLASHQVGHVALRCAGFNNVDLAAAQEFGIAVTR